MDFVLTPDHGPPRLIRYTTFSGPLISTVDMKQNLLLVDKAKFDGIDAIKQQLILTSRSNLELVHIGAGVTKLVPTH